MAAIHRVPFRGRRPQDPWYTEPVGAAGWDGLAERLAAAGAPFAGDLAAMRDELVALEGLLVPPASFAPAIGPVVGQPPRHVPGRAVRDRLGQLRVGRPEPGAGRRPVRVRVRRCRQGTGALRRVPALRRPRADRTAGRLLDDDAQLGHINEMSCLIWLTRPTGTRRSSQASRFHESVDMPLTVAVIDELLEALAG